MSIAMYSEEAETGTERRAALEREREELALAHGDTGQRVKKYDRLKKKTRTKGVQDKRLQSYLKKSDAQSERAARKAARMELLLHEEPGYLEAEGMERTHKFKQEEIAAAVPVGNSQHFFNLKLDTFGPYSINYSRHGRYLLIGGRKGHIATMDWRSKKLGCEFHVRETVRDVCYLHNEMMFAAAQKRYLYIYDHSGMELHCLKQHTRVNKLTFLPYHFLLVSADDYGGLRYLDTSVGRTVVEHKTRLGSLHCLAQNSRNAIVHLGHHNGTVTLWSPNTGSPLVKMLCHRGPVLAIAIDSGGYYMATSGMDARMKIWDVRTYQALQEYFVHKPAATLDISQRGLLALGRGREVEVWRDAFREKARAPYMRHKVDGEVSSLQFTPFEDCMGMGHSLGFTSMIVPGAGEANFDALEANPYRSKRQRQETEVKSLLEKIPSELITLDPDQISRLDTEKTRKKEQETLQESGRREKRRVRGRSILAREVHTKQTEKEQAGKELRRQQVQGLEEEQKKKSERDKKHVLDRFR